MIPTLDGNRHGHLSRLLDQIAEQDCRAIETILVKGDTRQGRAINVAAALAQGEYLMTMDDDTCLPDRSTLSRLVAVMDGHPDIGLAGGNNLVPGRAAGFVRRAMEELPRRSWPGVLEITDSDLAEHPCLIMRTGEFKAIGGENELIPRGLDPYLRSEYRKAGKRVVCIPGVVYHHMPPSTPGRLLRQFFRNGRDAAFVHRHYPQWAIETPTAHGVFPERVPAGYRIFRFGWRLLTALCRCRWIYFSSEVAYALGYLSQRFSGAGVT